MEIINGIGNPLRRFNWPVVTLGVFDGIHRGHLQVINKAVSWAKEKCGESIVLTFSKSPKVVLGKRPSSIITSLEHRLHFFERYGVNTTVVMEFDDDVANIKADDFIEKILHDWIGVKGVVLGYNCSFGKNGEGDKSLICELAKQYEYEVCSCAPVKLEGQIISSTLIREAIMCGDLERAELMLGRPVTVLGTVVSGSKRGSKVLFPTANLDLHHEIMPSPGVYGTIVQLKGKKFYAITNIGTRPTFETEPFGNISNLETVVEVHILDFTGSIYGQDLEVQFVCKIRDERKFDNVGELKKQIENDRDTFLKHVNMPESEPITDISDGFGNQSGAVNARTQKFLDMSNTCTYNASAS
ncbi:MAG: bifunctional riboflavin kinase/FAD synthetase [Candidatus Anammoxibacter sp.]